jgi:hypothetical protein
MADAVRHGMGKDQLEILERMFEFDLKVKAQQAKEAYHKSFAAFKANPPKIWREMQVKYGSGDSAQKWSHADLGKASDAIGQGLGEHQLNHTWRTEPQESGKIKVICIITHELGHSESTWLWSEHDKTGSKNAIQALGSAVYYLERYTLFALSGLAPAHMDNDGAGSDPKKEPEYISTDQITEIDDLLKETGVKEAAVLKFAKAESVNMILAGSYQKVKNRLLKNKESMREPGE